MRAHVVFRVHVRGDDVDRLAAADLGDFAQYTASALRVPMPVSTTSTAFLPTMMPTLGTSEALPSGIAQT